MATSSNAPDPEAAADIPPSKPLQIFLLVALLVSGAAYVADEWTQLYAPHHERPDRLHRLVESRSEYPSHMEAGITALRNKQYDKAAEDFRLALQAQNSGEAHYNLAIAMLKLSRPEEAAAQFREAIKLNPHYTDVYLTWGQALLDEGKPDEAAHAFHEALRISPNSGAAHFDLALATLEEEKAAAAEQRSAETDGRSADAATAGAKVERWQTDALQQFAQAQRCGFDRSDFWLSYGRLLAALRKDAEAESYLRKATLDKPELAEAHFALAGVERQLGKEADAIAQYQATLALRADDPAALEGLGLLYATATNADLRSPKMAVQLATRANDATTAQNPRFLDTLARCYAADGDFLQAQNWEQQAIHRAEQIRDVPLLRELRPRATLFNQHKTE
ncbi:MAG TPA: tetratricopeptide repeat protein [Verrucomicrobiae bacterium]|jgi:tetratricopeptide (TPR) repeat protein|nr:tetratricopeptide repeat protein [Verrucomicrobiae bacterium]